MEDLKIEVGGLSQLSRALKKVDAEAPKQLRIAFNNAAELLVQGTAPKIPVRSGAAKRSLKARSTRTSARVSVGGNNARYFPWLDFGGPGRCFACLLSFRVRAHLLGQSGVPLG